MLSRALLTYHLRQLRQSPATGIFLTCGWVAAVLLTFIPGQLIATNRAELTALFTYLPWVMAVLIPTLTMPVASETARGVTERLLTLPHTPTQRLFSRFAVYWALLGIWILGFWPLIATLYYLGTPDFGPIATGLLGTWLLAAPMLAVSLAICLKARSGVGGLLASLAACLLFLLAGTSTATNWLAAVPGLGWLPSITWVTLLGAYQPFTSGLLNLSAVLLLTGLTFFILGLATRPHQKAVHQRFLFRITNYELRITTLGALFLILALIPSLGWLQLDTTTDALQTPSAATITTLRHLEKPVTFTLHLSQNNPDVPAAVHQTAHSLTNLLLRLRAAAPGKINVKLANTDASTNAAIAALQAGATEESLPTGTTYFAALTARMNDVTATIPTLSPARLPVQEYDVMALVSKLTRATPPTIAVLTSHNEIPAWQKPLESTFTFLHIQAAMGVTEIPSSTAILMLPDDAPLPAPTMQAVRNYLGQGGNVILLTDSFSRTTQPAMNLPDEQKLSEILPDFGLTFISQTVIADPTQATLAAQNKAGTMSYPYWLQLNASNLEQSLPFTTGINHLFMQEAAELRITDLSTNPTLRQTVSPILTTSPNARAVPLEVFASTPAELATSQLPSQTGRHILAAMVSGAFNESAERSGNLLVFADTDWLNPTALTQSPENAAFLTSIFHYLSGQSVLTQLRAKGTTPRTLTRIESMANRLTRATTVTEQKIATELYATSQNPEAGAEREFTLRQQLRDIRAQTRHRLQMLENALLLLNLALMPTATGLLFFLQRRRQHLRATSTL